MRLFRYAVFLAAVSSAYAQDAAPGCISCHQQSVKGVHATVACATCHAKHEEYPHPENAAKPLCASCHEPIAKLDAQGVHGKAAREGGAAPDCAVCHGPAHEVKQPKSAEFRAAAIDTCGACHADQVGEFKVSVHGRAIEQGVARAPFCTDCHGVHSIQPHTSASSPVHPGHVRDTCGSCHGTVALARSFGLPTDRLVSFDATFHGLAARGGSQTVANCSSCHGVHNILPSSDAKSTIHPDNLAATCGHCHPGAGRRFAVGPVHIVEGVREAPAVRWVRIFYLLLIPLVIGLMLLHNLGDWWRKLRWMRLQGPIGGIPVAASLETRMLPFELVQHALLGISFIVLAWSGFALKYPDQWWTRPLLAWESQWPVRSLVHRGAALLFVAVTVIHMFSLIRSKTLRDHWRHLWPSRRDVTEGLAGFAYNLGLRNTPPARSSHSYIEKAEYWAVVWGAVVMILTGWMLYANNLMLRLLPKSVLDVATAIHFYEAVLATLAIVVWHFYFVIFDPEVYPMDTAWLTGKSVRKREEHP